MGLIGRPQTHLVFRIQIKLNAKLINFNVKNFNVYGCNANFLGLPVMALCDTVRKTVGRSLDDFAHQFSELSLPGLVEQIERIIHAQIGQEIAIPIFLADETSEILTTIVEKAEETAQLKGDLIDDLGKVAKDIASKLGTEGLPLPFEFPN